MTDRIDRNVEALTKAGIGHECYHDCIYVDLPSDFGILELKFWPEGDDSIQLLGGDFHTHTDVLAQELGQDRDKVFAELIGKILRSELLLIEETSVSGNKRRTIEQSLADYVRYLPEGTTYRVVN